MRIWLHEMERDLLDRIGSGAGFRVTLPGLATVLPGTLQLGSDNVMNAVFRSAVCDAMTTMSSPLYFKRSGQDVPSLESFSTAVSPASDRPTPDQLLVTHFGYVQAACSSLLSSLSSPLAELQREAALEAAAWSAIQPVAESSQPPPAVEVPLYVNFLDGPRSVEEMEASKVQPFGVVVKPRNVSVVNSDGIASVQSRIQTIVDWGSRPPEATTPSKGSEVEGVLTSGEASGDNLMKAVNSPSVVLFEQVVVLVCKLARLLSIPHRHGILLGQGGVGKRTVCKLAAQVLGCATGILEVGADVSRSPHVETGVRNISDVFYHAVLYIFCLNLQPVPMGARGEPICSAIDELKGFVKSAGVKGVHTVVIIPEDCLADPAALQCVAEYLSTGDAAGMFTREEISTFMQDVPSNELSLSGEDTQCEGLELGVCSGLTVLIFRACCSSYSTFKKSSDLCRWSWYWERGQWQVRQAFPEHSHAS